MIQKAKLSIDLAIVDERFGYIILYKYFFFFFSNLGRGYTGHFLGQNRGYSFFTHF